MKPTFIENVVKVIFCLILLFFVVNGFLSCWGAFNGYERLTLRNGEAIYGKNIVYKDGFVEFTNIFGVKEKIMSAIFVEKNNVNRVD